MSLFTSFSFPFVEGEEGNIALSKEDINNYIGQSLVILKLVKVKSGKVGWHSQFNPPGSVLTEGGFVACILGTPTTTGRLCMSGTGNHLK